MVLFLYRTVLTCQTIASYNALQVNTFRLRRPAGALAPLIPPLKRALDRVPALPVEFNTRPTFGSLRGFFSFFWFLSAPSYLTALPKVSAVTFSLSHGFARSEKMLLTCQTLASCNELQVNTFRLRRPASRRWSPSRHCRLSLYCFADFFLPLIFINLFRLYKKSGKKFVCGWI